MKTLSQFLTTLFLLSASLAFSQWTQMGSDIIGEHPNSNTTSSGHSLSLNNDGTIVAFGGQYSNPIGDGTNFHYVSIYQFNGESWNQLGGPIDYEFFHFFGYSISLSDDGNRIAIGTYNSSGNGSASGHVSIYQFDGLDWNQLGQDIHGEAAGDYSGWSVSLSGDGAIVAIGAIGDGDSGHVRIYQFDGLNWNQLGQDIDGEAAGDGSGRSVSLSSDGAIVAIGALENDGNGSNSGHVRIYQFDGLNWNQLGQDVDGTQASENFGSFVSLSGDGTTVAIVAFDMDGDGLSSNDIRMYQFDGLNWNQLGQNIDEENYFNSDTILPISLSNNGNRVAIGTPWNFANSSSGHVRIFDFDGVNWIQVGTIYGEANEGLGQLTSLSGDGNRVAIVAPGHSYYSYGVTSYGAVRVFSNPGENSNVFVGAGSGGHTIAGSQNTFLGDHNGSNNTEGSGNTFVGNDSGHNNTTGNGNTYMGESTGYSNTTGSGNLFLGYRAGYSEMGSDRLYIDNSDTPNPLLWGDFAADALRINGSLRVTNLSQDDALTRILASDTDGNLHWRDATTVSSDNLGNHSVQQDLLPDTDNVHNLGASGVAFGSLYFDGSLFINDAEFLHARNTNVAIGNTALSVVTTGAQNVGVGNETLMSATTGANNTAIGYRALFNNLSGSNNTAIGNNARTLANNLTNTTAVGNGALATGSNQIRIGNNLVTSIGGYANWTNLSDGRFKKNIREDIPGLDFIEKLRPVSYELDRKKLNTFLHGEEGEAITTASGERSVGFIAQDVEKVVNENRYVFSGVEKPQNEQDHYGIRYAEFVVPLTKAVQELSALVESQQQKIAALENLIYGTATPAELMPKTTVNAEGFVLYQNTPNPFDKTTTIKAWFPRLIKQAKIIVYTLNGVELESYAVSGEGAVSVTLSGGRLPSGMYLYALIADGQVIDTKKMLLTK